MTKKALVIGASRGIGLGLVKEFLSRGYEVVATKRPAAAGTTYKDSDNTVPGELKNAALDTLAADSPALRLQELEMTDAGQATNLAETLRGKETFDIVFINAGIYGAKHQRVDEAKDDELLEIIKTNVQGPLRLARLLSGTVTEKTGIVAAMSSRMGSIDDSSGGAELYRLSKVSLNMLLHGLAQEPTITDKGLTVLSVHPGWVQTDMGGANAPTTVEESAKGIADMLEARAGSFGDKGGHAFVNYKNEELPW